ncbi:DUF2778 domain-containing protein [Phyllobacterium sp. 628]|nr:DUF2778 domain-containing protein [Phyllobacterium sp. 628]
MVVSLASGPGVVRQGTHAFENIALVNPRDPVVRRSNTASLALSNPDLKARIAGRARLVPKDPDLMASANTSGRVVVSHDDAFAEPASALVLIERSPLSESAVTALLNTPSAPMDAESRQSIQSALANRASALAATTDGVAAPDSKPAGAIPLPEDAPVRKSLEVAAADAAMNSASSNPFSAQPDLVDVRRHEPVIPILASYAPSATESNPMIGPLAPDLETVETVPGPENAPDRKNASVEPDDADDAPDAIEIPLPLRRPKLAAESFPPAPSAPESQRPQVRLASVRPNNPAVESMPGNRSSAPLPNAKTRVAIYDISAGTVYLPNGEKLEAHSGMGHMLDNPRYTKVSNRGPTPPHTYDLTMREALFHGVAAIRLTPIDGRNAFGRNGLLAHTYMLGPRGDSNGCVVFKDYRRFLKAYQRGEVTRLVVVEHMPSTSFWNFASR